MSVTFRLWILKCNTESRATMNCYLSLESRWNGWLQQPQTEANSLASLRSAYVHTPETSTCWGAYTVCLSHLQLKSPSHSDAMLTRCNDSQLWNRQLRFSETGGRHRRSETWPSIRMWAKTGICLIMSLFSSYTVKSSSPDYDIPSELDFIRN